MVQMQSSFEVADNSGAKRIVLITVLGQRKTIASIGDIFTATVKEAIPGGTAVYSYADKEQVRRIVGSDLPSYVELRSRVNGNTPASKLRQLREISVK